MMTTGALIPAAAAAGFVEAAGRQFHFDWKSGEWNTGEINAVELVTDGVALTLGYAAGGAMGLKAESALTRITTSTIKQDAARKGIVFLGKTVVEAGFSFAVGKTVEIYYYNQNRSYTLQSGNRPAILI